MKPRTFWTVLTSLSAVILAAAGCQGAPATPEATRETFPTISVPTAASPSVQPSYVQPSATSSPLPQPESSGPGSATSPLPVPSWTPQRSGETATVPIDAAQAVEAAQADLVARLGSEQAEVKVVSVEPVDWPDASLGCPQPGVMYAQVITPGFLVVLEAKDKRYEYHTDRGQGIVLCKEVPKMDAATQPGSVEPGLEPVIDLAKEDLAQRLSIPVERIIVLEARSVVWPDASLGCPQPDMRYRQVPQDGALIRLSVEGRVYEYHSGGGRAPFLCEQVPKTLKGTPNPRELTPPGSESD